VILGLMFLLLLLIINYIIFKKFKAPYVWRKGALAIGAGTAAAMAIVGSALMSEELATKNE